MIGLLWVFFEKVGLTLLSVLATFWYAVILGPDGFGFATTLLSVSLLISTIQDSIQQTPLLSAEEGEYDLFAVSLKGWLFLSVFNSLLLFIFLVSVYGFEFWGVILFSVIHIPVSSVSRIFIADLLKRQEYKKLALRAFLGKVLGVCVGLLLAFLGNAEMAIILQSLIAIVVALVVMISQSEMITELRPFLLNPMNYKVFKASFVEGVPSGVNALGQSFRTHGVIILLGFFIGNVAVGLYSLASKLVDVPRMLIGFGMSSWVVGKLHSAKENIDELLMLYSVSSTWAMMLLAPCYFGIISISESLIFNFFGDEWLEAANILSLLAIYNCIMSIFLLLPPLQVVLKRTHRTVYVNLMSTVVVFTFIVFLFPFFGVYSPIVGMFLVLFVMLPKYAIELSDILKTPFRNIFKCYIGFLVCAFLMCATVMIFASCFNGDDFFLLIFVGVLSYTFYIFLLFVLYRRSYNDIVCIKEI